MQGFFVVVFGCTCSVQKFLGQGLNLHYSCDLCHSGSKAGSLSHCATQELPMRFFIYNLGGWIEGV